MNETVMVFCAHPDDETIGMGGTIAKFSKDGKEVIAVVSSYGEGSHPWMKKKYTVKTRVKESKMAGNILGCTKRIFLGLKDTTIAEEIDKKKTRDMITDLVKKYKPGKVFTHSFDDIHKDHRAVFKVIKDILDKMDYKGDLYTFNVWNPTNIRNRNYPKMIIDISKTFKIKMKALKVFKSQKLSVWQLMPLIVARAFKHGFEGNCLLGEKFFKVK